MSVQPPMEEPPLASTQPDFSQLTPSPSPPQTPAPQPTLADYQRGLFDTFFAQAIDTLRTRTDQVATAALQTIETRFPTLSLEQKSKLISELNQFKDTDAPAQIARIAQEYFPT